MKREQLIGKHGEQLAESVLNGLGIEMIEKVGTPVKLIPLPEWAYRMLPALRRLKNLFQVIFGERVSADRRGILPNGRSVLIEVKTIMDRNLTWSDLRPHQPGALSRHAQLNGLSLLVWVHDTGVYVMRWPIPGFGPGKGITPAQAKIEHDFDTGYIEVLLAKIKQEESEP